MSDYQLQKHTDFDIEDIDKYLKKVKTSIAQEKYSLALNREKNKKFSEDYNLTTKKIKNILFNLDAKDFCYAVDNEKEEYSHEVLYIFCCGKTLSFFGDYKDVDIYIKFNLIKNNDYLYIISFHELEKSITFLFK